MPSSVDNSLSLSLGLCGCMKILYRVKCCNQMSHIIVYYILFIIIIKRPKQSPDQAGFGQAQA